MDTVPDKQIVLRNNCEGLDKDSVLGRFASKLKKGFEITLTPEEAKRLVVYVNTLKHGFTAAIPLICTGERCPYAKKCPLGENNTYPIGKECPTEGTLLEMWYNDYMRDLDVNPDSKVDTALVGTIAMWDILSKRAAEELANKPEIIRRNIAGFQDTKDGVKPIYREELNQIINFMEKAERGRLKALNALIATREAKSKDAGRVIADPSVHAAKLLEKAKQLAELDSEEIEVEAEVIDEGHQ